VRRIARAVGANRQTVQGWLRSGQLPTWRQQPRGNTVDRHAEHLDQRWNEGCHNAAQLWREIQEQGFRGQLRTVQRWVRDRRGADPAASGPGRVVVAMEHRARGGADQPPEDDQADHVRPRRVRAAAPPRPASSLNDVMAAPYLHRECGRTGSRGRLTRRSPGSGSIWVRVPLIRT